MKKNLGGLDPKNLKILGLILKVVVYPHVILEESENFFTHAAYPHLALLRTFLKNLSNFLVDQPLEKMSQKINGLFEGYRK